jgi:hypothetical protein
MEEKAIQTGCNVTKARSFVSPSELTLGEFDIKEIPIGDKIFHQFSHIGL